MEVRVAKNAGFCFGVKRAVDGAFQSLKTFQRVYILGHLIHNGDVIRRLEDVYKRQEICKSSRAMPKRRGILWKAQLKRMIHGLRPRQQRTTGEKTAPNIG